MKINPIYARESKISGRNFYFPLIIFILNGVLSLIVLLNMYSVASGIWTMGDIQYTEFINVYAFLATCQFVLILIIIPIITAGMISGEKERKTFDIIFTTKMTPGSFVTGKIMSAVVNVMALVFSSVPVFALTFMYGGIVLSDIVTLLILYFITAVFTGSIGIFISSFFNKTVFSVIVTYIVLFIISFSGLVVEWIFKFPINKVEFIQIFNPFMTFIQVISRQAGAVSLLDRTGLIGSLFIPAEHDFMVTGLIIQGIIAVVILAVTARRINPLPEKLFRCFFNKRSK